MELLIFLVSLFVLLLTGMPVAVVLMLNAVILLYSMDLFEPILLAEQMLIGSDNFILTTVPFFMLAGEIMKTGGISKRLIRFGQMVVGRFRGGMGYVAILASMLFAGMSGAAIADVSALGAVLIPMMVSCGYDKSRSTGLICAASLTAPIIPPSIPMIVLGVTVNLSIGRLFVMGLVPGILLGLTIMATWFLVVRKDGYNDRTIIPREEIWPIVKEALPALFLPVIIIAGIRMGIFTPTEGGAVACVYAFIVGAIIHRELKLKDITAMCFSAVHSSAVVMFIVSTACTIGWLITFAQVPQQIISHMSGLTHTPMVLMIVLNLLLLCLGMVMDITPIILIFAPVIFPLVTAAGIEPYYFALIMIINLCIGLITPPVGTVLYVGCSVSKLSLDKVVKGILPFLLAEFLFLVACIVFPQIITVPAAWFGYN